MHPSGVSGQYLRLETPGTSPMHRRRSELERSSACSACSSCMWRIFNCFKGTSAPDSSSDDRRVGPHEPLTQYRAPAVSSPVRVSSASSLGECDHEHGTLLSKRSTPEPRAATPTAAADAMLQEISRQRRAGAVSPSREWPTPDTGGPQPSARGGASSSSKTGDSGSSSKLAKGGLGGSSLSLHELEAGGVGTEMLVDHGEEEDEDCCPTCLEVYTGSNPRIWTRCGHHFHMQCIYEWLERKETCPLCESHIHFDE